LHARPRLSSARRL